jgi:hypothetical protein
MDSQGLLDPSRLLVGLETRSISPENPTAARGSGGTAGGGRKGAASRLVHPGEEAQLADFRGTGVVRRFWLTYPPGTPAQMRSVWLEIANDDAAEPSVVAPVPDFFAMPHGRPVSLDSALVSVHEGRGFNSYFPMPFRKAIRIVVHNHSDRELPIFFQLDLTLGDVDPGCGFLHASFRRENPTTLRRDFVVEENLEGPGRFVGASIGIRPLGRPRSWYGEGEVKMFIDGDGEHPTICGTGLEDYVGSAWGMDAHQAQYAGVPLIVPGPDGAEQPLFVSLYRWHILDPIVFRSDLRVTLQQIGGTAFTSFEDFEQFRAATQPAGRGWLTRADMLPAMRRHAEERGIVAEGLYERQDDVCSVAYTYCRKPQPVPPLDLHAAIADIGVPPLSWTGFD